MTKQIYEIDGQRFATLDGFYEEIDRVLVRNVSWDRNLGAFNDILRGGFGTPDEGFAIKWRNSSLSRQRLGYEETVCVHEDWLRHCHPSSRESVLERIRQAQRRVGATLFDQLVAII
jgi:RNAse (barnase) inhibitor barstar